jgi:aspartate aminotransferase-like enzyme
MEGSIRNLVQKKVLNCMCGAFSDKWLDVSQRCGKQAEGLQVEWGSPVLPDLIDQRLATGMFDALTLVHNETSTGVLNPLADIATLKSKYPDVMFIVDTVSSFSVVDIPFDRLGIDVLLTGSQKALAMPPGLALFTVSPAALERASTTADRGYYFDFCEFQANGAKNMTPSTPSISHLYALESKLEDIFDEGLQARFDRHARLSQRTRDWAANQGFELFCEAGYESRALTCINNGAKEGGRVVDLSVLQKRVKEAGITIDGGYGKIKGKTFRLSNMGDETDQSMSHLYQVLDTALEGL